MNLEIAVQNLGLKLNGKEPTNLTIDNLSEIEKIAETYNCTYKDIAALLLWLNKSLLEENKKKDEVIRRYNEFLTEKKNTPLTFSDSDIEECFRISNYWTIEEKKEQILKIWILKKYDEALSLKIYIQSKIDQYKTDIDLISVILNKLNVLFNGKKYNDNVFSEVKHLVDELDNIKNSKWGIKNNLVNCFNKFRNK